MLDIGIIFTLAGIALLIINVVVYFRNKKIYENGTKKIATIVETIRLKDKEDGRRRYQSVIEFELKNGKKLRKRCLK